MDKFVWFKLNLTTLISTNGDIKKKLKFTSSWKDITFEKMKNHQIEGNATAIVCGEVSNISVIDFDTNEVYNNFIELRPHLKECKTTKTRKGYHIYFQYTDKLKTKTDSAVNIDIRSNGSIIIAPPTKYFLPDKTIIEYEDLGGTIFPYNDELTIYYDKYFPVIEPDTKKSKYTRNLLK